MWGFFLHFTFRLSSRLPMQDTYELLCSLLPPGWDVTEWRTERSQDLYCCSKAKKEFQRQNFQSLEKRRISSRLGKDSLWLVVEMGRGVKKREHRRIGRSPNCTSNARWSCQIPRGHHGGQCLALILQDPGWPHKRFYTPNSLGRPESLPTWTYHLQSLSDASRATVELSAHLSPSFGTV